MSYGHAERNLAELGGSAEHCLVVSPGEFASRACALPGGAWHGRA
jgi:hypothetical protein